MESGPHRSISALRSSQDRPASLVQPLSPQQLRSPSYHAWTIAEVLSHLGSQASKISAWLAAGRQGTEPPSREFMQRIWDDWNAKPPEEGAADSLRGNERLVERFEALTDDQLAAIHLSMFGMELGAAGLARMRLSEHALHTWDIAVALDPSATLSPDAVALLIDTLGPFAGRAGKPQGTRFRLHVHTDEPARDFALQVGDTVEISPWEGSEADGELHIPAEALIRLVYGRLDPDHTPPVELTGATSLDDLRAVFPGF